jgi:hypothetical protein
MPGRVPAAGFIAIPISIKLRAGKEDAVVKPWIGKEYVITQLLILGESAYSWVENGEIQHPTEGHEIGSVKWTIENFDQAARTMKKLGCPANPLNPQNGPRITPYDLNV